MSNPANQTFALALLNALGIPPNSSSVQRIMATIGASGSLIPVQSPVVYDPSSGALTVSSVPQTSVQGLTDDLDAKVDVSDASAALVTPSTGTVPREIRHIAGDEVNVRNFDTVGDGVSDDTTAIQNAIDACPDGGAVWFPLGRYKITSTLVVNKHIRLHGDFLGTMYSNAFGDTDTWVSGSIQGSVLESHLTSGPVLWIQNNPRYLYSSIEHLSFLSIGGNTTRSTAIQADFSVRGSYRHINVCNFYKGIYINGSEDCSFSNIFIGGCDTGMLLDNTANANVLSQVNVSSCRNGISIVGSSDNMIGSCAIQGCTENGISIKTNSTSTILQNIYFENVSASGYGLDSDSAYTIVAYNHFGTPADKVRLTGGNSHIYPTQQCTDLTLNGAGNIVIGKWNGNVTLDADAVGRTIWLDFTNEFRPTTDIRLEAGKSLLLHSAGTSQRLYREESTGDTVLQIPAYFRITDESSNTIAKFSPIDGSLTAAKFIPTTPIVPGGVTTGFTAGGGTTATHQSTFTGGVGTTAYTVGDVVNVLKRLGLMPM